MWWEFESLGFFLNECCVLSDIYWMKNEFDKSSKILVRLMVKILSLIEFLFRVISLI